VKNGIQWSEELGWQVFEGERLLLSDEAAEKYSDWWREAQLRNAFNIKPPFNEFFIPTDSE